MLTTVRYYLHGDAIDGEVGTYYCHRCDSFVSVDHFYDEKHVHENAARYETSLRALVNGRHHVYRPARAINVLYSTECAAKIGRKESARSNAAQESGFYKFLKRRVHDSCAIGDFAKDATEDNRFPYWSSNFDEVATYLASRQACVTAAEAFEKAWKEWSRNAGPGRNGRANKLARRFAIFKRDGYRCQMCGDTARNGARLEVDHKHPVSEGGSNEIENLWTLCFECNRGKGSKLL